MTQMNGASPSAIQSLTGLSQGAQHAINLVASLPAADMMKLVCPDLGLAVKAAQTGAAFIHAELNPTTQNRHHALTQTAELVGEFAMDAMKREIKRQNSPEEVEKRRLEEEAKAKKAEEERKKAEELVAKAKEEKEKEDHRVREAEHIRFMNPAERAFHPEDELRASNNGREMVARHDTESPLTAAHGSHKLLIDNMRGATGRLDADRLERLEAASLTVGLNPEDAARVREEKERKKADEQPAVVDNGSLVRRWLS